MTPSDTATAEAVDRLDHRLAARLMLGIFVALCASAALGISKWPGQMFLSALESGEGLRAYHVAAGVSLLLVGLFWGSRPARAAQRAVLLAWPLSALALYGAMSASDSSRQWLQAADAQDLSAFAITALSLPALAALLWRLCRPAAADDALHARTRRLALMLIGFVLVAEAALSLSASLHPMTLDPLALAFVRATGTDVGPALAQLIAQLPGLPQLVALSYRLTPIAFLAVALLQLRGRPAHLPSAVLTWVGLTGCAFMAYHAYPIAGPLYLFANHPGLTDAMPSGTQALEPALLGPAPRNGMPSMHFGWLLAATLLWWRQSRAWPGRVVLVAMTVLTGVATLTTGEHYLIDLVVAVPFVLSALALFSTGNTAAATLRWRLATAGALAWLAWVLLARLQIDVLVGQPALGWALMLATLALSAWQARALHRLWQPASVGPAPQPAAAWPASERARLRALGWMFLASGLAALMYQVLFARQLALVFGSTATATYTVLATFLGGMSIGSVLGGHLAARTARPLLLYAAMEGAIALYCMATPHLFGLVQQAYVALAGDLPAASGELVALRVALGALVLLVPTVAMGATLPLLAQVRGASGADHRLGQRVAWLYFANTGGAALGALLAAYWVIPSLGARRTTLMAAALNLLVALAAVQLFKREAEGTASEAGAANTRDAPGADVSPAPDATPGLRTARRLALLTLTATGVLSLGLEVVYTHQLSVVAGNSAYAFGLMLATFLVGLSVGGEAGRRLLLRGLDGTGLLAALVLGLAAALALVAPAWNAIPSYFGGYAGYPDVGSFRAREAIRGLVCSLVMVPPALFIGGAYVVAMELVTRGAGRDGARWLGYGAALNTLGNISGVLLFGFVLLPRLGGQAAGALIAVAALALALLLVAATRPVPRRVALAAVPVALLALAATRVQADLQALSTGANVYFMPQPWGRVIDHAESVDGGLTLVARGEQDERVRTLLTNGKFQGNNAESGEMQAQIGFALAPLLHQDARGRALVIGYGTGVTSRVLHEAGFAQLDVAELSADIVRLADRHFGDVNRQVSRAPGVNLQLTDGRNLLLLQRQPYDLVSIEITSIWFAGAASLYNRDFYRLVHQRLTGRGVLQQWLQLHRLSATDILSVLATLRSEFRFVSLYVLGSQGIVVATDDPQRAHPRRDAVDTLQRSPALADVRRVLARPVESIAAERLLDPAGVERFLVGAGPRPDAWISTDDNMLLEYSTPKANVNDGDRSFKANLQMLQGFRAAPAPAPGTPR